MKRLNKILSMVLVSSVILLPNKTLALTKDETVYTTLKSNGELYKTTITNHLYNSFSDKIEDTTELKNILNINGKEKFIINGSKISWDNKGNDIFYQGEIEKELPIETSVKYYLDGKEMDSKDMPGKKGQVKIVMDFKNNDSHIVNINNEQETLYTPFVVTVGTILNNKNNSNVEITNGKIVNSGSRNILVSVAAPGLYDSLGIEEFKNMDSITITYDTTNYKESSIYIVATPKLLESSDLEVFNKLDNIYSKVDDLQTNMNTIENGANTLEEGASKLASGSKEISDNLGVIASYMKQLEAGSLELDNGLRQTINSLESVSNNLNSGNTEESIASLITLKTKNTYAINTLQNANDQLAYNYNNYNLANLSYEEINSLSYDQATISNLITLKKTYEGNLSLITLLTYNNTAIDSTIKVSKETLNNINSLITNLKEALNKLEAGSNTIYNSTSMIRSGVDKLYVGSLTLTDGVSTLYNGTAELRGGIASYNNQGIKVLSSYKNEAMIYTTKLEKLTDLSNQYKGFSADNVDSTTFVSVVK